MRLNPGEFRDFRLALHQITGSNTDVEATKKIKKFMTAGGGLKPLGS